MFPAPFVSSSLASGRVEPSKGRAAGGNETRAGKDVAGGRAGLVHASYLFTPSVSATARASLLRFNYPPREQERKPGRRGKVKDFSRASRWRLRLLLASMDRAVLPVMLTLTYPRPFPRSPNAWKEHLDSLSVRMAREMPGLGAVWKLEFQEDGAPHFHLFVYGLEASRRGPRTGGISFPARAGHTRQEFRQWVSRAWAEVVDSGDEKHLRAGTRVERIRSQNGVQAYVAGYVSKQDQTLEGEEVGRYWGKFGVENLPMCEAEQVEATPEGVKALTRTARRFMLARRKEAWRKQVARAGVCKKPPQRSVGSFTLICDVEQWLRNVPRIIAGRRAFLREREQAWAAEGWSRGTERSGVGMRQHPGPRGPSASTVQPARRLSALRPKPSTPPHTPGKGVGSIGASDASGGLPVRPFMWEFPRQVRQLARHAPEMAWAGQPGRNGMKPLVV